MMISGALDPNVTFAAQPKFAFIFNAAIKFCFYKQIKWILATLMS